MNTRKALSQPSNKISKLKVDANDSEIIVNGTKTRALIDSGSMITCISEEFQSLNPIPELHSISEFGLTIHSANGTVLPFSGFVELEMCVPWFGSSSYAIPALVVPQINY